MQRTLLMVGGLTVVVVLVFWTAFWAGGRMVGREGPGDTDDLEWLRREFRLGPEEVERVRRLHEAYVPECLHYCRLIAEQQDELDGLLARGDLADPAIESVLGEMGRLRAQCQAAMLRHFQAVSEALPEGQGRRYLAEMQRWTLGSHEAVERRMAVETANPHGHH